MRMVSTFRPASNSHSSGRYAEYVSCAIDDRPIARDNATMRLRHVLKRIIPTPARHAGWRAYDHVRDNWLKTIVGSPTPREVARAGHARGIVS
jgi:hypothetical protein